LIKPFSFLIDKDALDVGFEIDGVRTRVDGAGAGVVGNASAIAPALPDPPPWAEPDEPMVDVPLIQLAWARSGDKGNISNIGVIARRAEWLPLLWARLTPDAVKQYFAHLVHGKVERFHLPGIAGMNLLLHDALDGGGPASSRFDPLGKGMAQMLLDLRVAVPRSVADRF
jgi:hypothetical protein